MSNRTRNLHVWRTRDEEGRKREVRAQLFGSKWTLTSRCKGDEDWTTHPTPQRQDLEELETVLFNKYQRKHVAWEHLLGVRQLLAKFPPVEDPESGPEDGPDDGNR